MIKTFRNKGLQQFWETGNARKMAVQNTRRVTAILNALNAAGHAGDMDIPGFRLHAIPRIEKGRFAVDASGNFRITFSFDRDGNAVEVDLEDYH